MTKEQLIKANNLIAQIKELEYKLSCFNYNYKEGSLTLNFNRRIYSIINNDSAWKNINFNYTDKSTEDNHKRRINDMLLAINNGIQAELERELDKLNMEFKNL